MIRWQSILCLIVWLLGWFVSRPIDWLINRLIDRLIDWLIIVFSFWLFRIFSHSATVISNTTGFPMRTPANVTTAVNVSLHSVADVIAVSAGKFFAVVVRTKKCPATCWDFLALYGCALFVRKSCSAVRATWSHPVWAPRVRIWRRMHGMEEDQAEMLPPPLRCRLRAVSMPERVPVNKVVTSEFRQRINFFPHRKPTN